MTAPSWTMEVVGQVFGLDLAALFLPQPAQGRLVIAHDNPGIRAADIIPPMNEWGDDLQLNCVTSCPPLVAPVHFCRVERRAGHTEAAWDCAQRARTGVVGELWFALLVP